VALNGHSTPTAAFVKNANWQNPAHQCVADITLAVGAARIGIFDADAVASRLMGDSIFVNPVLLGYAWQRGWIPLGRESLLRAIELNAVAVESNKAAFEWGRQAAHDWTRVQSLLVPVQPLEFKPRETVESLVARRVGFLADYQNAAYAQAYKAFVAKVQAAEAKVFEGATGKTALSEAVARYLFKLMAVKDEYEVARLHMDRAFLGRIDAMFEGDFKLHYHLAPPLIAKRNLRGELIKRPFGPAMGTAFKVLARLKGLRGTVFDPFGRSQERREEHSLIAEYRACIEELLAGLNATNHALAVEIARLPEQIRGYGHVKARHLAAVRPLWAERMASWRGA
jgi:indolepyruvate ferredoxin oxidoreductase